MATASTHAPVPRRAGAELIVKLDEFAQLCGVSLPTMQKALKDAPLDAPWILERGRRGRGYKIDATAGAAWWRARVAMVGEEDAERQQRLVQLRLEMLGGDANEEDVFLPGKERREEFQAGEAELAYREAMGELVKADEIEGEISNAVIELRRQLQTIGTAIRRRFDLDPGVATAIEELIGETLKGFLAALDGTDEPAGGSA